MMHDGTWFDEVIPQSIPFQVSGDTEVEGARFNAASLRVYPDCQYDGLAFVGPCCGSEKSGQ